MSLQTTVDKEEVRHVSNLNHNLKDQLRDEYLTDIFSIAFQCNDLLCKS
jgi:hypothetical protein